MTLVIAEAGVNHNGDLALARRLVEAAAGAGADLVKFQTFTADSLVTATAAKAGYQAARTGGNETQRAMLKKLEITREMHESLIEHSRRAGIGFFSTAFDIPSLDMLAGLGQQRFKIPSGEITNLPYLRHAASFGKPLIVSTGMCTLAEVGAALDTLTEAGAPLDSITLLHCSTEYPAPMDDVNLRAMGTLHESFGVAVGYSDHTEGIEVATAAVALGASVIEKHFTVDRNLPGPDHRASLEPAELRAMVSAIRNIELALGDGVKRPAATELLNRDVARKSLVAARPIKAGERFSEANLAVKRPGTGISPMRWDDVIGKAAPRGFDADELIEL